MKNLRVLALVLSVVICNCTSLWAQIAMHSYKVFGGSKADQYPSLSKTNDGGFIIAFETESNDFDCLGNHGETDKVASLKYSLPEGLNQARVMLVDLEGKVVYTGLVSGSVGTLQVDVSNLKGGVYQCIVEGENARGRCKLVVI